MTTEAAEPAFELPDVNVLVALTFPDHVHHLHAGEWFETVAAYATTPITEAGLVRHALNPRIAGQQLFGKDALNLLRGVRQDPRAVFLADDSTLVEAHVSVTVLAGHRQVTDLHLLNLVAAHGGRLVTFDRAIERALIPADHHLVHTLG